MRIICFYSSNDQEPSRREIKHSNLVINKRIDLMESGDYRNGMKPVLMRETMDVRFRPFIPRCGALIKFNWVLKHGQETIPRLPKVYLHT
jgi:hypothetical protein